MPQLAVETYASQLVWLGICFAVLYLIMAKVAIPSIGGVLDDREQRIRSDLNKAEALHRDTERTIAEHAEQMAAARAKANETVGQMKAEMHAEIDRRGAEIDAELAVKQAEAEREIAGRRDAMLGLVDDISASVAAALVEKLVGAAPADARLSAAVTAARKGDG